MFSDTLKYIASKLRKGHGVSILIPFQSTEEHRVKNFNWVYRYLRKNLPGAQIIIGHDAESLRNPKTPFSKSAAVNDAASRATGDVFVILDADGYVDTKVILRCADDIRKAIQLNRKVWYVPYSKFLRLTLDASKTLLKSSPKEPYQFPISVPILSIQSTKGSQFGSVFGAMVQILPREAFELIGGWDERFRGWGGEDRSALCAVDTLYCNHRITMNNAVHIWHPMQTVNGMTEFADYTSRIWDGQGSYNPNSNLSSKYFKAYRDVSRMRKVLQDRKQSS